MRHAQLSEVTHILLGNATSVTQHHSPHQTGFPAWKKPVKFPAHLAAGLYEQCSRRNSFCLFHRDAFKLGKISSCLKTIRQPGISGGIKSASRVKSIKGNGTLHPVIGLARYGHRSGEPQLKWLYPLGFSLFLPQAFHSNLVIIPVILFIRILQNLAPYLQPFPFQILKGLYCLPLQRTYAAGASGHSQSQCGPKHPPQNRKSLWAISQKLFGRKTTFTAHTQQHTAQSRGAGQSQAQQRQGPSSIGPQRRTENQSPVGGKSQQSKRPYHRLFKKQRQRL